MANADLIRVEVSYCPAPGQVDHVQLQLSPGTTLSQALQASGVLLRHGLDVDAVRVGVWGRAHAADGLLRDRDRVEIYRPLLVDPKEARRQRYGRHKLAAQARKDLKERLAREALSAKEPLADA